MNDKVNFLKFFFEQGKYSEDTVPHSKIADLFPALVYIYDAETGRLSYGNRKFLDFFHIDIDNKVQENVIDNIVFNEDLAFVKTEIEKFHLLREEETHCFNCRFNHTSEEWRHFKTSGTVLRRTPD